MARTLWKVTLSALLGGGILFFLWALILAATARSVDVSVRDRYVVISPAPLLVLSAVLLAAAYFVWKVRAWH